TPFLPTHLPSPSLPTFPSTTLFRSRSCRRAQEIRFVRPAVQRTLRQLEFLESSAQLAQPPREEPPVVFSERRQSGRVVGDHFAGDRKSTRLNSSHVSISYAVFCLKK